MANLILKYQIRYPSYNFHNQVIKFNDVTPYAYLVYNDPLGMLALQKLVFELSQKMKEK